MKRLIDLIKEKGFTLKKKQEADDIQLKQWQMLTTQMILYFSQIQLCKQNPYCIAWGQQPEALIST